MIYASAASRQSDACSERRRDRLDARADWVQVSRLGNPLINEVVIPLGQKDYVERLDPADDSQFVEPIHEP